MKRILALLSVLETLMCNKEDGELLTMEIFSDGSGNIYYKDDNDIIVEFNDLDELEKNLIEAIIKHARNGD